MFVALGQSSTVFFDVMTINIGYKISDILSAGKDVDCIFFLFFGQILSYLCLEAIDKTLFEYDCGKAFGKVYLYNLFLFVYVY